LEMLFGLAPIGLAVFDRQMVLLKCNTTWAEFINRYTPTQFKDVIPRKSFSELAPGAEEFFSPVFERVLRGETVQLKAMRSVSGGIESFWDATFTPLFHQGKVVGVLDMTTDATERIQAMKNLEKRMAERTAEIQHRQHITASLTSILAILNSTQSSQSILDFITRRASELLGADACVLYSVRDSYLTIESTYNLPKALEDLAQGSVHRSIYNPAHLHHQPAAVSQGRAHIHHLLTTGLLSAFQRDWYMGIVDNYQSYLAMPLLVSEALFGGLMFYYRTEHTFSDEDLQLGESLAGYAALAIENNHLRQEEARHLEEAEQRRRAAESLGMILAVINSDQSLEQILSTIVQIASQLLGANACVLHHVEYDQQFVSIQASYGLPEELQAVHGFPLFSSPNSDAHILERQPTWIEDFGVLPKNAQQSGESLDESVITWRRVTGALYRAWLAVPLVVKDQVYGSLAFYFTQPQKFEAERVELATNFANQTSLALENAQLHAQAEETAILAERNRLARELHDAITQTLFSTSLIAEVLPRLWERNPAEGLKRLEELRTLTRGALAEMRTLLLELRPSALMDTELNELIRHLVDAFNGRSLLPTQLDIHGAPFTLPSEVKVTFYRIAQEALNNTSKHSAASQVEVNLHWHPTGIDLAVSDDGCGFDPGTIPPEHLGISIMQERAANIGARLVVQSALGKGTHLSVSWCASESAARVQKTSVERSKNE
jgi:signal transduction histidine kinase